MMPLMLNTSWENVIKWPLGDKFCQLMFPFIFETNDRFFMWTFFGVLYYKDHVSVFNDKDNSLQILFYLVINLWVAVSSSLKNWAGCIHFMWNVLALEVDEVYWQTLIIVHAQQSWCLFWVLSCRNLCWKVQRVVWNQHHHKACDTFFLYYIDIQYP